MIHSVGKFNVLISLKDLVKIRSHYAWPRVSVYVWQEISNQCRNFKNLHEVDNKQIFP